MNINIQATTRIQEMLGRFLHLNKMKAKSFISGKNGTKTAELQKLITSMPDVFKLFWEEETNVPRPNYFETCSRHHIWNELSLNICYVIYALLWNNKIVSCDLKVF